MQRVITKVSIDILLGPAGIDVQHTHHVYESSLAGGRMVREVDRYQGLSPSELTELLEVFASMPTVGDPYHRAEQLQMTL